MPVSVQVGNMESKLIKQAQRCPQAGRERCRTDTHQDRVESGHKTKTRQFPRKKTEKHRLRPNRTYKNRDISRGVRVLLDLRNQRGVCLYQVQNSSKGILDQVKPSCPWPGLVQTTGERVWSAGGIKDKSHWTEFKKQPFIQDYCNRGERVN